ncbi:MAG: hypothetical protein IPN71_12885 [Fibrobacteres bacterium]|nr:hypothetical protein [Fibrobacterota bacterium]
MNTASAKRVVSFAGVLFAGLVGLHSCENVYQADCTLQTWTLRVSSDSASFPDSVPWSGPWETGVGRMARERASGRIELDLHLPLDQDTLQLEWRQMGVRQKTVWCVRSDETKVLVAKREVLDPVGAALLGEFWRSRGGSPANAEPATAIGLRKFFATRLLAGDSLFRPFPESSPAGIHPDTARLDTWVAACRSGWPMFRVLGTWSLSTDSAQLRTAVRSLIEAGRISSSDTNALFQVPLRARGALSQTDIVQSDSSRPAGSFSWAAGLEIDVRAAVRLRNFSSDSIVVSVVSSPGAQDTAWDVAKGISLRAGANTATGLDTLVVWLRDRSGRYALESRTTFKILPRPRIVVVHDSAGPSIDHPTLDSVVEWKMTSVDVRWSVMDLSGLDSIWIDSRLVSLDPTGFIPYRMILGVGANVVVLKARDSAGNFNSDTIRIYRKADTIPPLAIAQPGAGSRQVPFDSGRASAIWHVSDNHKPTSCRIGGVERLQATTEGGWICRVDLDLNLGVNVVPLVVRDSFGNLAYDTIRIERLKDAAFPTARALVGQGSRAVPFDSTRAWVGWEVADSYGLEFCKIAGTDRLQPASGGGWVCRTELVLDVGQNLAPMVLQDSAGNWIRDTIRIRRDGDMERPVAEAMPGLGSRNLGFDSTSASIGWRVSDNHLVESCRIEGRIVPVRPGGICSTAVELAVGTTVFRLEVVDKTGNVRFDSVAIERFVDTQPPQAWAIGSDTIRVVDSVEDAVIRWVMSDNHSVGTIGWGFEGKLTRIDTIVTTTAVGVGTTEIQLLVRDSTGNTTIGHVVVLREADAPRHRVDSLFYTGASPDTLDCPAGCDSIEISRDRISWTRVDRVAMLDAPGTWYARSFPGKAESWVTLRQALATENVFAGVSTSFFLRGDSLFAAGRNDVGQLGIGEQPTQVLAPVFVRKGVKKVVGGEGFTLMLLSDGQVVGVGSGPLSGWTGPQLDFGKRLVSTNAVDIACGKDFFLVLDAYGMVWSAGANTHGQLGIGDSANRTDLSLAATGAVAVGAGWFHSIRLDSAGNVWAVGSNASGQLGNLAPMDSRGWRKVAEEADAVYSSMGAGGHRGLGANDQGQLSGSLGGVVSSPLVLYPVDAAWAAGGASHVLVMADNGDLKVAGSNLEGQIGLESQPGSSGFHWIATGLVRVAAGWQHSLLVKDSGEPMGMGANSSGELGQGVVGKRTTPVGIRH